MVAHTTARLADLYMHVLSHTYIYKHVLADLLYQRRGDHGRRGPNLVCKASSRQAQPGISRSSSISKDGTGGVGRAGDWVHGWRRMEHTEALPRDRPQPLFV